LPLRRLFVVCALMLGMPASAHAATIPTDLTTSVTPSTLDAVAGETVGLTATVRNQGGAPLAQPFTLTAAVGGEPSATPAIQCTGGGTPGWEPAGTFQLRLYCHYSSLDAGATQTLTATYPTIRLMEGGGLGTISWRADDYSLDQVPGNDSSTFTQAHHWPNADVSLRIGDAPRMLHEGERATIRAVLRNNGPDNLRESITVRLNANEQLKVLSIGTDADGCLAGSTTDSCVVGPALPAGTERNITVQVQAPRRIARQAVLQLVSVYDSVRSPRHESDGKNDNVVWSPTFDRGGWEPVASPHPIVVRGRIARVPATCGHENGCWLGTRVRLSGRGLRTQTISLPERHTAGGTTIGWRLSASDLRAVRRAGRRGLLVRAATVSPPRTVRFRVRL
jgi:hypothetical protein